MGTPFFDSPEKIAALRAAADRWLGTPFRANCAVPGAGVDCVQLCAAIYLETGVLRELPAWPRYRIDSGKHLERSQLTDWLEAAPEFERVATPAEGADWTPGDLVTFTIGRSVHHAGVVLWPRVMVHVLQDSDVCFPDTHDSTLRERLESVWRPLSV